MDFSLNFTLSREYTWQDFDPFNTLRLVFGGSLRSIFVNMCAPGKSPCLPQLDAVACKYQLGKGARWRWQVSSIFTVSAGCRKRQDNTLNCHCGAVCISPLFPFLL